MSTTSPGTIADSIEDGTAAAAVLFMELEPEHFTNPGADSWGDPGCNLADAASELFNAEWSRHYDATTGADIYVDWEDEHWDAFRDAFEAECRRRAKGLGWDLPDLGRRPMIDPATLAAELARLQGSDNPVRQAIADLYRQGRIRPVGVRDGDVVWKTVEQVASDG